MAGQRLLWVCGFLAVLLAPLARGQQPEPMRAYRDHSAGKIYLAEGQQAVLGYQFQTAKPPDGVLDTVPAASRKYAQPRSDYIHPLFGLDGEVLTADWSKDHPHHRGIYWAWPEVDYHNERGDLHALQRVFARPTGEPALNTADDWAELRAVNQWLWDDRTPIVRETATIRAWRATSAGRSVDLDLKFEALADDVALARRGQSHYGGLNVRLAAMDNLQLSLPAPGSPRGWGAISGTWTAGQGRSTLAIVEHNANPGFPAQWIEYRNLPWFQPTFPAAGIRYLLRKDQPLELRYRLIIVRGDIVPAKIDEQARQFRNQPAVQSPAR